MPPRSSRSGADGVAGQRVTPRVAAVLVHARRWVAWYASGTVPDDRPGDLPAGARSRPR